MTIKTKLKVHPVASLFPEMSDLEYFELKEDIRLHGLKVPILLSKDGRIVDGRHRAKACYELGIEASYTKSKWDDDATLARDVVSMNLKRRHLTESQLGMVGARLRGLFEADAKKRADEGRKAGTESTKAKAKAKAKGLTTPVRSSLPATGRTAADDAANKVGVSSRLVEHGVRVLKHAIPEVIEAVDNGILPLTAAASLSKKDSKRQKMVLYSIKKGESKNVRDAERKLTLEEQVKAIRAAIPVTGKLDVLVVDPPWTFHKTREDDPTQRGRTPYPTMTEEQIKAIKLPIADNAIVWLWVTNAHLITGEAARVLLAWGLEPKSLLTWVKPRFGIGDWLRGQTEHCILAVKGRPVVTPPIPSTVLMADLGAHSEKPDKFYEVVQALCPGSKGELFSRKARDGWTQYGAELGSIPSTPVLTPPVFGLNERGEYTKLGTEVAMVASVDGAGFAVPVPVIPPAPAGTMPPIVPEPDRK